MPNPPSREREAPVIVPLPPSPQQGIVAPLVIGTSGILFGATLCALANAAKSYGPAPGSTGVLALGVMFIVGSVLCIVSTMGVIGGCATAARLARRLAGELGATVYGSRDSDALLRQAALAALASETAFDSPKRRAQRWNSAFARLPRPVPAIVAERFVQFLSGRDSDAVEEGPWRPAADVNFAISSLIGYLLFAAMALPPAIAFGEDSPVIAALFFTASAAVGIFAVAVPILAIARTRLASRIAALHFGTLELRDGVVHASRHRSFSPRDSILIVQPSGDAGQMVIARFIGPAGVIRVRAGASKSSEVSRLLAFWRRAVAAIPPAGAGAASGAAGTANGPAGAAEAAEEHDGALATAERLLTGAVGRARLEEELPAAVAPGSWREAVDDEAVPTAAMPLLAPLTNRATWTRVGTCLLIQVLFFAAVAFLLPRGMRGAFIHPFLLIPLLSPIGVAIYTFARAQTDRGRISAAAKRIAQDPGHGALARTLATASFGETALARERTLGRRWADVVQSLESRPLAVVAPAFALEVRSIGRTGRFLEPHAIQPAVASSHALGATVIFAILTAFGALMRSVWLSGIFGFLALVSFIRVPFVWYRLPLGRGGRSSALVGPGWLALPDGRTWTVRDSLLILAPSSVQSMAVMRFVGPAGARDFLFTSTNDPEFIALWRLWTHRDPRPELTPPPS